MQAERIVITTTNSERTNLAEFPTELIEDIDADKQELESLMESVGAPQDRLWRSLKCLEAALRALA